MSTTTETQDVKIAHTDKGWEVRQGRKLIGVEATRAAARALRTATIEGETAPVEEETIEPATNVTDEFMAMDYRELADVARTEHAAVVAARKSGDPIPATPATDAMRVRFANGETYGKAKRTTAKAQAQATPPPATPDGGVVLPLRSVQHGEVITSTRVGSIVEVVGLWLVIPSGSIEEVLAATAEVNGLPQYHARLLTVTYVQLRQAFPTLAGVKPGPTDRIVDGLHGQVASGHLVRWSAEARQDGGIAWTVVTGDGEFTSTGRDIASRYL